MPAQPLPVMVIVDSTGDGMTLHTKSLGVISASPTLILVVLSARPYSYSVSSFFLNSAGTPYLNVTLLQSISLGTRLTSSCSTFTTSTSPMPPGKLKISGSENCSVHFQCPSGNSSVFSHTTGGARHSSIVVHTENPKSDDVLP